MTTPATNLPIAVIGAGPVGLAAAAHLLARGLTPLVLESGGAVGDSIRGWSHVRFFSPWKYTVDPASVALLEPTGWTVPDPERAPTGAEIVARYLEPLAALPLLAPHLRFNSWVTSIARRGYDKLKSAGRDAAPFVLRVECPNATEEHVLASAVIDASGTWRTPNPLGADGLSALGEDAAAARIFYGIPDVLGIHRERYAGKRVLVVGSGHSAFNALLDLAELAGGTPRTEVIWAVRRTQVGQLFGGEQADALPERGRLGSRTRQLVDSGRIRLVSLRVAGISQAGSALLVRGEDGLTIGPVDEIVCATGFRPDLALTRELRLDLDPAVEAPRALAPLIDPSVHSCGTVPPHGAEQLQHPEPDFYTVGMKSYGRAPTFLLLTGYEQVRSVAAAIAGDWDAARKVELTLPETGVCSTAPESPSAAPALIELASFVPTAGVQLPVLQLATVSAARPVMATALPTNVQTPAVVNEACCSVDTQAVCCAPSEKSACCGEHPAAGSASGCGCI